MTALRAGRVVAAHGRHCMVEADDGTLLLCHPRGKKNEVVVGDRVQWAPAGDEGVITPFGSLTAERKVTIEDPAIGKLAEGYISARDSGDTKKASALREKLLAARYNRTIAPGKWFAIDKPTGTTSAKPARFSAKVKWFPEKDRLRAVVEVVDCPPRWSAPPARPPREATTPPGEAPPGGLGCPNRPRIWLAGLASRLSSPLVGGRCRYPCARS